MQLEIEAPVRADPPGTTPQSSSAAGVVTNFFDNLARFNSPSDTGPVYMRVFGDMLQPGMRDPQSLSALLFGIGSFAGRADPRFTIVSLAFAQASICITRKADGLKGAPRNDAIAASLVMANMAGMSQPRGKTGEPCYSTRQMVSDLFTPLLEMSTNSGRPLIEACRTASDMTYKRHEHEQLNYYGHIANRAAKALGAMTKGLH